MGTRNLSVVIQNNEVRVAQYCQWDGYISGQGLTTLNFLRNEMNESFKDKVAKCSWISKEESKKLWVDAGADPESDMVSMDVSDRFKQNNFQLHRDCGADIYSLIQNSEGLKLQNDINFASDSLFCEWVYVVDLDKNTFEVYKGFNKEKLSDEERFAFLNVETYEERRGEDQYYPVKFIKSYDLNNLPTEEELVADFTEDEE